MCSWSYTCQWNLLDYPSAVFPVSKVDSAIDTKEEGYKPRNKEEEFLYNTCTRSSLLSNHR